MNRILFCWLALVALVAVPARANFECYLKMSGVQGEATAEGHSNEVSVLSFAFELTHPVGGAAQRSELVLTKLLDKASPTLALKCADGSAFPDATITCRSNDSTRPIFYRVLLYDVTISRVAVDANAITQNRPSESVSVRFNRIRWEYYPILPDGTQGPLEREGWDFQTQRRY